MKIGDKVFIILLMVLGFAFWRILNLETQRYELHTIKLDNSVFLTKIDKQTGATYWTSYWGSGTGNSNWVKFTEWQEAQKGK